MNGHLFGSQRESVYGVHSGMKRRIRTKLAWLFAVSACLLAKAPVVSAQNDNGSLWVTVLDPQRALVSGAAVSATDEGTGITTTGITSSSGLSLFPDLLAGTYTVRVEAKGFALYEDRNVLVIATQATEVIANLKLGATATEVNVYAGANVAKAESLQMSGAFEGRAISDVPIVAGANYSVITLSIFLPNTTTAAGGTSGAGGSIGGLRGRQNSFSIDGADNNDPTVTAASQNVIPEAVQQFVVNQNVFNAEFGRGSGGQFNIITKSGSSQLHWSAWLYNMNRSYDAADNQEHADIAKGIRSGKRRFDFNRPGGEVGGAILPDKLFFYGAFEFSDLNRQATAPSGLAPTSAGMAALNTLAADPQVHSLLAQFPIASRPKLLPGTVCLHRGGEWPTDTDRNRKLDCA